MSRAVARRVLRIEAAALLRLARRVGPAFERAVELIAASRGRVVVTGMGKSGLVGQKIAATLSSTGTAALALNPAEALHGDLGAVRRGDVVLALSNSGETEELARFLDAVRRTRCRVVLFTGNLRSSLAQRADVTVDAGVEREACSLNLAPTASTTAAMALGDALAVALLERRGFTEKDFALFHPAGDLGRRLQRRVSDVMRTGRAVPRVGREASLFEVVREINAKRLGATCVTDRKGKLCGIVVDGDLRRALLRRRDVATLRAKDLATPKPVTIRAEASLGEALQLMEDRTVYQLVVVDRAGRPVGFLHLHDLLGRGKIRIV